MKQLAQGDVLFTKVAALPTDLKIVPLENGAVVFAHGEVTGHKHQTLAVKDCELLESVQRSIEETVLNVRFLRVMAAVDVVHEEHGTVRLEPGIYRVSQQREYEAPEIVRQVAD